MSNLKRFFIGLTIVFIAIQFMRPQKNISNLVSANRIVASEKVQNILATSCNDCHSNNTVYPWYYNIQPIGFWLAHHVDEGKEELNFDEFNSYSPRKKYHKVEELEKLVNEGEMPLSSYTMIHKNAVLSAQQKETLINWSKTLRAVMETQYPIDSLIRKQKPKAL